MLPLASDHVPLRVRGLGDFVAVEPGAAFVAFVPAGAA